MCLPLGMLKCIVRLSAWITFLIALGPLAIAILLTIKENNLKDEGLNVA